MIRILEETGTESTIEITLVADVVGIIFSPDYFKELGLQVVDDQTVVQMEKPISVGGKRSKSKSKSKSEGEEKEEKEEEEKEEKEEEEKGEDSGSQEVTYPYKYFYNAFESLNDGNFSLKSLFKRKKEPESEPGFFGKLFDRASATGKVDVPTTTPAGPGTFTTAVSVKKEEDGFVVQGEKTERTYLEKMQDAMMGTKQAEEIKEEGKGEEGTGEEGKGEKTYLDKMKEALIGVKTADEVKEKKEQDFVEKKEQSEAAQSEAEKGEEKKEQSEAENKGFLQGWFGDPNPPKGKTAQVKLQVFGTLLRKKEYEKKKEECKADPNNIEASPIDGKTRQETNGEIRDTGIQWRHKEKFLNALSDEEKYKVKMAYDALPKDDEANSQIFYVYVDKEDKAATVLDFRLFKEE